MNHGGFQKEYCLDLIAEDALYEIKTVSALVGEHDAQVLHYAMLLSVNHGKLLNFRNAKVEGRLRFNAVMAGDRRQMRVVEHDWKPLSPRCNDLKRYAIELLDVWGGFLDFRLYNEALTHHLGGEASVTIRSPLIREGVELGRQRFSTHFPRLCFIVTGFPVVETQEGHLMRLLRLTEFEAMQWLNFHHDALTLVTLTR